MINTNEIMNQLEHRYPFLLVDKILELIEQEYIVACKNVTVNEPWAQGHFQSNPIYPGVLTIETAAQVGGLMLVNEMDNKRAMLSSVSNFKFIKPIVPGDQIIIKATLAEKISRYARVDTVLTVDDKKVAQGVISYCFCL